MGIPGQQCISDVFEDKNRLIPANRVTKFTGHCQIVVIRVHLEIERTYNQRRRQRSLQRLTPIEYESIMNPPAALAA